MPQQMTKIDRFKPNICSLFPKNAFKRPNLAFLNPTRHHTIAIVSISRSPVFNCGFHLFYARIFTPPQVVNTPV